MAKKPTIDGPYQTCRALAEDEYGQLRASIQRHGVLAPAIVDENGTVIDGHHRMVIADDLGIPCKTICRSKLSDAQKRKLNRELNDARRHWTATEKRERIKLALADAPERSDRDIAGEVGASPTTVGTQRKDLEASGQVSKLDTSRGADGKSYPRDASKRSAETKRKKAAADSKDDGGPKQNESKRDDQPPPTPENSKKPRQSRSTAPNVDEKKWGPKCVGPVIRFGDECCTKAGVSDVVRSQVAKTVSERMASLLEEIKEAVS